MPKSINVGAELSKLLPKGMQDKLSGLFGKEQVQVIPKEIADKFAAVKLGLAKKDVPPPTRDIQKSIKGQARQRTPFLITSEQWKRELKSLVLPVNPKETRISFPTRRVEQKTKGGAWLYEWRRPLDGGSNTAFDIIPIAITFQSGNLMPYYASENAKPLPTTKLEAFRKFIELINQPVVFNNMPNYITIYFNSIVVGEVTMKGYFSPEGVELAENSDNPYSFEWPATFNMITSSPKLWELNNGETYVDASKVFEVG